MAKIDKYTAPRQTTVTQRVEEASDAAPLIDPNERLEKIENLYQSNKKNIGIGLGVLVALPLLYMGYKQFIVKPSETKAADALGKVSTFMMMDSTNAMLNGDGKTMGAIKIAKEYSGTDAGNLATYMAGAGLLKQGKFKEAVAALEKFDGRGTTLGTMATGLLGDAYWENKQLDKAAAAYETAGADESNIQFAPVYLQRAGMVYEALGKSDKAIAAYNKIKEKFPQSRVATEVEKNLARLGAVGI
jgi:predicted negative regulator of RcsB-dependent stress response